MRYCDSQDNVQHLQRILVLANKALTTHGMSHTKEYGTWCRMRNRCFNTNNSRWKSYGGRGITVCEQWNDFSIFYQDMGNQPEGTSLDRIDNDGNYEQSNCRWASNKTQCNNQSKNLKVTYCNATLTIAQWAKLSGFKPATLQQRYHSGARSADLFVPLHPRKKR